MGQVTVTLNGRSYRLRCGDGEEQRLIALADHVRSKLNGLVQQFGQAGEDRLLLMSALLIADELWDARARLNSEASEERSSAQRADRRSGSGARVLPADTEHAD
jgi:cell division protein ZapA